MEIKDWLPDNELGQIIWEKKYRQNHETLDEWFERVSGGDNDIKQLIIDKKFLFGGRALKNRGGDETKSMFNCYSRGFIEDNMQDIIQADKDITLTFVAEGGQGLSLSKIRPKDSPIKGKALSAGVINWVEKYENTTKTTLQGGGRRGALLISLDIWHKDSDEFIRCKTNLDKFKSCNISVEIDDDFMNCVLYSIEQNKTIYIKRKFTFDSGSIDYEICPLNLFKLLCESAKNSAEPGVIFTNRFRNYNLMEYVTTYNIENCNPCGR